MIQIGRPIIGNEEKRAVMAVLDSGMLAQGKVVAEFERRFAEYIGVKFAIAVGNGTQACTWRTWPWVCDAATRAWPRT